MSDSCEQELVEKLAQEYKKLSDDGRRMFDRISKTIPKSPLRTREIDVNWPFTKTKCRDDSTASFTLYLCNNEACTTTSVKGGSIYFQPVTLNDVQLKWDTQPSNILMVKKPNVKKITKLMIELASWLNTELRKNVYVLDEVKQEFPEIAHLKEWNSLVPIDFIISLGGDGTILYLVQLFPGPVPPIVAFSMGSLGFLTVFQAKNCREVITKFIMDGSALSLRERLDCKISRGDNIIIRDVCLNEVVVDRGTSPHLTNLDCYVDNNYCTTVQGDGCIVSTTTGSTAYNLAAGGSICHPQAPCLSFTPICPHSLSFRPMVFQHSVEFKIVLSHCARGSAWASFDGRNRTEMQKGDVVTITLSRFPVPIVCETDITQDWLSSVARCLRWNSRDMQKSLQSDDEAISE